MEFLHFVILFIEVSGVYPLGAMAQNSPHEKIRRPFFTKISCFGTTKSENLPPISPLATSRFSIFPYFQGYTPLIEVF